jgi:hypothetical protein
VAIDVQSTGIVGNLERRNVVKRLNLCLAVAALAAAGVCGTAQAAHVGVFIGGGVGVPYYYPVAPVPYYYPYYPPVVAVPAPPPVDYVEQGQQQPGPGPGPGADTGGAPNASWYYCDASRSYYPYVKDCPAGWRAVAPQAAPSN